MPGQCLTEPWISGLGAQSSPRCENLPHGIISSRPQSLTLSAPRAQQAAHGPPPIVREWKAQAL